MKNNDHMSWMNIKKINLYINFNNDKIYLKSVYCMLAILT